MKKPKPTINIEPETMWAIHGVHGFYIGTWHTRREAIMYHCAILGKNWWLCKSKGDRAVKVTISEAKS